MTETDEALVGGDDSLTADPAAEQEAVAARSLVLTAPGLAWLVASVAFVALRLPAAWTATVGGAELAHLSGAWEARAGEAGERFAPTLFQALTTLLLHADASALWPRLLVAASLATIPPALYLLRRPLGEAGALATLVLLALDAPAAALGVRASAMGFDLALCFWLVVLAARPDLPGARTWALALAGFAAATAGPLVVPALAGVGVVASARRLAPTPGAVGWMAGGAALGVAAASAWFGLGWDGLRVPPFDLFSASYSEYWSTLTAAQAVELYGLPVVLLGAGAAAALARRLLDGGRLVGLEPVALGWAAAAGLWWATAADARGLAPAVALTTALALLAGPALATAATAMVRADWSTARFLLPAAALAALLALARVADWARLGAVGGAGDQAVAAVLAGLAVTALVFAGVSRASRPTLLAAVLAVLLPPMAAGALRVATGAEREPVLSPYSPAQVRELRDLALAHARAAGGPIVVDPSLRDAITWPFRDSGDVLVSSRPDADAAVLILPAGRSAPEGMTALQGEWAFTREVSPPDSGLLRVLRWYIDRNAVEVTSSALSVYLGTKP